MQCSTSLTNCLECSAGDTCTRCARGYRVNNGACEDRTLCTARNCLTCVSGDKTKCQVCNAGYTVNDNKLCKSNECPTGMNNVAGVCTCPSGSYASSSTACSPCSDSNCLSCDVSSCSLCRFGFYPSGNTCAACINNCQECTDGSTCKTCTPPYIYENSKCTLKGDGSSCAVDATGKVFTCEPGCQACKLGENNVVICTLVASGYALSNGAIIKCDSTCKTCSGTPTSCLSCYKGYALNGDQCTSCTDPQALTCSEEDAAYSLSCSRGYTKVVNAAVVPPTSVCTVCAANCFKCDVNGAGKCDSGQCQTGYVQQTGQTTCTLCFNQCPNCSPDDLGICLECGRARFKDAAGLCVSCPSGCKQCTSATVCSDCFPGFLLSGTLCVAGPSWPCVEGTAAVCTKCVANYNIIGGQCSYDTNCNNDNSCTSCSLGFYLSTSPTGKCL